MYKINGAGHFSQGKKYNMSDVMDKTTGWYI